MYYRNRIPSGPTGQVFYRTSFGRSERFHSPILFPQLSKCSQTITGHHSSLLHSPRKETSVMTAELTRHLRHHSSVTASHLIVWASLFFFLFLCAAVPAVAQTSPSI